MAILSITLSDGEIHPVAFHSRTLTAPELNYDTHNKELLAIFKAFQKLTFDSPPSLMVGIPLPI